MAAGGGVRLGAGRPKALVDLDGSTLLEHAVARASASGTDHVIVVAPAAELVIIDQLARPAAGRGPVVTTVPGGADRVASVRAGMAALAEDDGVVLVHDAARALAPTELFTRVVAAIRSGHPAVVPGVPVADTVKVVDEHGVVRRTLQRSTLRAIQTPQGFLREELDRAHASAGDHAVATDDAALVELAGGHVLVIEGDPRAEKITTAQDLARARWQVESERRAGDAARVRR